MWQTQNSLMRPNIHISLHAILYSIIRFTTQCYKRFTKSAIITHLLPSSVQLHHNPFIFWVKNPSKSGYTVSCKKEPRLSKLTQSWHISGSKKAFHSSSIGEGGQKIFIVWSHKRHNKAARYSIHLPLRYAGRAEQDRFCCCINERSCFPNLHPLPRHQTHRPRHTGGLWGEPRWLDYQTFQLDKLGFV